MMKVIPKISFVDRNSETGKLTSYAVGIIYDVDDTTGQYFIDEGLADVAPSGGGDFTTATVEIESEDSINLDYVAELFGNPYIVGFPITEDGTYAVPLYKGNAVGVVNLSEGNSVTVTGGVQFDADENVLIVTGDGTITVKSGK